MSAENVRKEKYEYLFLDIEWNQEPGTTDIDGREPVQIAIVAADEELQKVKTFSKSVRLDDPTVLAKNTIKISHVSLQDIKQIWSYLTHMLEEELNICTKNWF